MRQSKEASPTAGPVLPFLIMTRHPGMQAAGVGNDPHRKTQSNEAG